MSSETPADPDRPTTDDTAGGDPRLSADASPQARPRRARQAEQDDDGAATPGSPTTPVRFPARTAGARRGAGPDVVSARQDNTDTATGAAAPERTASTSEDGSDGNRAAEDAPAQKAGTAKKTTPAKKAGTAKKAAAKKPAKKAAAGGQSGQAESGQNKSGQGKAGQGKAGGQKKGGKSGPAKGGPGKGDVLPTRRKRFRVLQGMGRMEPRPEIPDQSHLPPEQRTDLAVKVNNLSITYRTSFEKKPTLRQALTRFGRGQRAVREVEALQDVSFEVRTGSAMGIIGANGAGKSTLMRAMAGILPPTKGSVEVWGRASTLLALGVGFNNSLSGRENIILGGLAAGLSRAEVEERANEIADWTELGDFIDMPMRTYSSGMFSRVAFSVAVHMEPDILMIDEALSTGDAHFKEKASAKMAELRSKARAMFLVSHGLGTIKDLCDEAIWINKGHLMERGEPEEIVDHYLEFMQTKRTSATMDDF